MSSTPEAAETPESKPNSPKKKVSTQRRIISWILILILLGVVLLEWRAKTSQAKTFENLNAAMDEAGKMGEVPFKEFQETMLQGQPAEELDDSGAILKLYHYRWNGIFKTYHLRMLVDQDDQVIVFDTAAEGNEVSGMPRISKQKVREFVEKQKAEVKQRTQPAESKPESSEANSDN
ncbi:hypothetical protein Enr10x_55460 [Gimesia panareensis]|uniref:Uncharacterized protein n=1 Tax=Gimesia panareensis TaxID=2527978 RepID=A0A517QEW5_9PLAN|nr:hypothetical protein [Gimesia panareensis]QDT30186.1 hypothetical protein Enr10x_55460 [Gimesia panareensis]